MLVVLQGKIYRTKVRTPACVSLVSDLRKLLRVVQLRLSYNYRNNVRNGRWGQV